MTGNLGVRKFQEIDGILILKVSLNLILLIQVYINRPLWKKKFVKRNLKRKFIYSNMVRYIYQNEQIELKETFKINVPMSFQTFQNVANKIFDLNLDMI